MSGWREQALIHAPVDAVWCLVGDPGRFPEWAGGVVEITGLAEVEEGAMFKQRTRVPLGTMTTSFEIEGLDDLHEIRLRCVESGYYSHWVLTEAGDDTFADVELGIQPLGMHGRVASAMLTKRWYRRMVAESLEGLRRVVGRGV